MWPLTIGLTGTIGAGKSTVAALLSEHGAEIVSGDTLGKIAVEESDNILHDIRERFGATVFSEDGSLNRREFGHVVFVSAEHSEWLTERTFPTIFQLWCDRVKHCKSPVIVLDAALIFEWKIEIEFDLIIVVLATPDRVKQRLAASDRLSAAEI
jgi:dephospho-CoA kinase